METDINTKITNQFKVFLAKQEDYFSTVEEQEEYRYNIQGLNDHIDDILKLIFGISELTEDQLKYRLILLKSLTEGFKESDNEDRRIDIQADSRLSGADKFDTVIENYLARSLN